MSQNYRTLWNTGDTLDKRLLKQWVILKKDDIISLFINYQFNDAQKFRCNWFISSGNDKKNNEINKVLLFLKQCCAQSSFPSKQGTSADFPFWHQQSNLIPSLSPPTPSYPLTQALILVGFAARPFAPLHNRQAARPNKTLFHSLFSWKRRNTGIFSLCRGFSHWLW